ncbi:hypothetical protein B0J14DRAFT_152359 [Halenospora varia]|nr:hypothetical protein B0J14DRAFT_152359 [Halenospora varia]
MSSYSSNNNSAGAGRGAGRNSGAADGFKSAFSAEQMAMAKLLKEEQMSSGGKNAGRTPRSGRGAPSRRGTPANRPTRGRGGHHTQPPHPPHHSQVAVAATSGRGRGRGVLIRGSSAPSTVPSRLVPIVRPSNVPSNAGMSNNNTCNPFSSGSVSASANSSMCRAGMNNENFISSSLFAPAPKPNQRLVDDFFGRKASTTSVGEGEDFMMMDVDEMPSVPALVPSRPAPSSSFAANAGMSGSAGNARKPKVDEQMEVVNGVTRFKPNVVKKELTYLSGSRWA